MDLDCQVKGSELIVQAHFDYDEGSLRQPGDYDARDAKRPFYNHLVDNISLLYKSRPDKEIGSLKSDQKNYGYYRFETYDGTFLTPMVKVDLKNDEGSVLVIRAGSVSSKPGNPTGNAFHDLHGKLTMILRGKDRTSLPTDVKDLRDADVVCTVNTD